MIKGVDHIGVSIVFFCHDVKGRFLMAKRGINTRDEHGCWDPGGGALEYGEHVEDALVREVYEEYGVIIYAHQFLGYRDVHRDGSHWIALDFRCNVSEEAVNNEPHKHDKIGWFNLNNLPCPLHSQFNNFIDLYKDKLPCPE